MELMRAEAGDISRIRGIIEEARSFQLSYGNRQWAHGYPSLALIEEDIRTGIGYKAVVDGITMGYLAIVGHDAAYDSIDGRWLSDGPYIALHRIAFSDEARGHGLFPALIDGCRAQAALSGALSIRIDTDRLNPIMQHLLEKLGFSFTGYVIFEGDRKLAYELMI